MVAAAAAIAASGWCTVVSDGVSHWRRKEIVEADDAQVLRDAQAGLGGRPYTPRAEPSLQAKTAVGRFGQPQQLAGCGMPSSRWKSPTGPGYGPPGRRPCPWRRGSRPAGRGCRASGRPATTRCGCGPVGGGGGWPPGRPASCWPRPRAVVAGVPGRVHQHERDVAAAQLARWARRGRRRPDHPVRAAGRDLSTQPRPGVRRPGLRDRDDAQTLLPRPFSTPRTISTRRRPPARGRPPPSSAPAASAFSAAPVPVAPDQLLDTAPGSRRRHRPAR